MRERATAMRSPCLDMVSKSSPLDRKAHRLDKRKASRALGLLQKRAAFEATETITSSNASAGLVFHFPKNVAWTVEITAQKSPRAPKGSGRPLP